jgi:hypothetical protein
MSIQNNFPAIRPSLNLDFANTKELDSRVTFTRASTATYYGTQTAKAEENLLLWSQDFQQTGWLLTASTIAANNQTAPDGTTTADTLTFAGGGASCRISRNITASALDTTRSVFVKAGTTSFVQFLSSGDANAFANFDVSTGTVGTVGSGVTASAISVGSGWYRLVMAFAKAGATEFRVQGIDSNTAAYGSTLTTGGTVFLWGAQLEQRSSVTAYTPTTTQPITNYIPVLETAASGVARFDHNPITFESLGFLVEEQRTNLFTYSDDFANAAWSKTRSSISSNVIIAPDGTLTGDKLVDTADASTTHFITQSTSFVSGTTYTTTLYAKQGEIRYVRLGFGAPAFGVIQIGFFDLQDGVVTGTAGTVTTSMTSVGNGWWMIRVTATATATTTDAISINLSASGTGSNYTGDGYSGLYIWGAQLEAGAFPTSYIPTVASQVTRAADSASITGANFSSWYRADEGTFYIDYYERAFGVGHQNFSAAASNTDRITFTVTVANLIDAQIISSGTDTFTGPSITLTAQNSKVSLAYALDNAGFSANGSAAITDLSVVLPAQPPTAIYLGSSLTGTANINSTIKKLAFYPKRISDTELIGLTS